MSERKTALTPEEMITAAFLHYVRGVRQQDIAMAMGGVNIGGVNEACSAIAVAVGIQPGVNAVPFARENARLAGMKDRSNG